MSDKLAIVFDGPPSHESGRFVEVELNGASISFGEWQENGDYWELVLPDRWTALAKAQADRDALEQRVEQQDKDWLLMMQEISHFDKQTDWHNAGDDELLEQFDPWATLRSVKQREEA